MAPEQPIPGGGGGEPAPVGGQLEFVDVEQSASLRSFVEEIRQGQRFGRSIRRVHVPWNNPDKLEAIVAERVR